MTDLIVDNEFKELLPPLSDEKRKQLETNLLRDGVREPLTVWNGILIDGHNRYEIAQRHGLTFTTVEKQFEYEKEYGKDTIELPKLVNDEYKDKRFYIIDDICATGNTLDAIKQAIEDLGGIVVGEGVVMNIVELNNNKEIFSLIDVNEE